MLHGIRSDKNKILRRIVAVVAGMSIIAGSLYFGGEKAEAANITLRGIEKLVTSHSQGTNPFVIVEVVPNLSNAKIGYFIGGEEPIDVNNAKSIKDMPSNAERNKYMTEFAGGTKPFADYAYDFVDGYAEADDAEHSYDIRGEFVENTGSGRYNRHDESASGDYTQYSASLTDAEREDANTAEITLYRKVKRFSFNKEGGTGLHLTQYPADGSVNLPVELASGDYNEQYFLRSARAFDDDSIQEGDYLFEGGSSDLEFYAYVETIERDTDGNVTAYKDKDGNDIADGGDSYWSVVIVNQTVAEEEIDSGNVFYVGFVSGNACFDEETAYSPIHRGEGYDDSNCPLGEEYYKNEGHDYQDYDFVDHDPYDSDYDFKADYSKTVYESFRYNNGIINRELFKEFVFDRTEPEEKADLSIDVVTITMDKLGDWVDKADLVYFAGGDYPTEVSSEDAVALYKKVYAGETPVMMEYSTYADNTGDSFTARLALLLMQGTLPEVNDNIEFEVLDDSELEQNVRKYQSTDRTLLEERIGNPTADISYAYGRVFVNDDANAEPIINDDFITEYSGDRVRGFTAVKDEIENELSYIELTVDPSLVNSFNQRLSKATSIRYILNNSSSRTAVKDKLNILDIEPYQSNQYDFTEGKLGNQSRNDLNYGFVNPDNRETDNTIASFEYRDIMTPEWVIANLEFPEDKRDSISIRQMGTKELVGINTDLNSAYDLIYIGMDTAIMNTGLVRDGNGYKTIRINGRDIKIKSFADTRYNNSNLNGLVYTHVGDTFNNYTSGEGTNRIPYTEQNVSHTASGNDITIDKLRELKDYVQAGYAVILSDSFFNKNGSINTTAVDSSSNMYQFVDWLKNGEGNKFLGKNVQIKGNLEEAKSNPMYTTAEKANPDFDANRKTMATYLNLSKLDLIVNSVPVAYNGGTMLEMASDGNYYLDFDVELKNDSSIDTTESVTYDCKLYLDMDADGKYEEQESLGGLMINGGSDGESDGKFHLTTGKSYKISRAVPADYVGFLSWKLEFTQNERAGDSFDSNAIRRAITGFSAVPFTDEQPVIYILQIIPNWGTSLDLKGSNDERTTVLFDSNGQDLYKGVKDFKVMVHQEKVSDYIKREGLEYPDRDNKTFSGTFVGTHYEYLSNFDMVVFGFGDSYAFTIEEDDPDGYSGRKEYNLNAYRNFKNNRGETVRVTEEQMFRQAILGIREYALSGRSMLFTHDLTSYKFNRPEQQGYFTTHYLSDVMGFDRFGISEANDDTYSYETGTALQRYEYKYDEVAKSKGSDISDKVALNDMTIAAWSARRNPANYVGLLARDNTRNFGRSYGGEEVTALNEGQITQYPYLITSGTGGYGDNSTFSVNATHSQWYQLNLDSDSSDTNYNDDVVVWYAISNKGDNTASADHQYYKEMQNDARNNYYIYTKGNITYTGAGHSAVNDQEKKLFINTLVASYNSGLHAPRVSYKENPWEGAATISSTYLPYDPDFIETESDTTEGGFLDNTLTVNFKTMNNNFRTSTEFLNTAYYVEVESGGTLTMNGKSYARITPKSFKLVDAAGNKIDWADASKLSNYKIYQATFDISAITLANSSGGINKENAKIYIRIGLDELADGNIGTEPATESMNPLGVYTLRLFDLE